MVALFTEKILRRKQEMLLDIYILLLACQVRSGCCALIATERLKQVLQKLNAESQMCMTILK